MSVGVSGRLREGGGVVAGAALLTPGKLRGTDHRAQAPVALGITGEHQQVPASRVGDAAPGGRQVQAELSAEDRADPGAGQLFQLGGGLRELGHPVHAVVIGDGQRRQATPGRLSDQFGRSGRPVEEAVRGMAVQLGPRWGLFSPAAPVATVSTSAIANPAGDRQAGHRTQSCCPGGLAIRVLPAAVSPGQAPLELLPRHWRVVPAHDLLLPRHPAVPSVITRLDEPAAVLNGHQPGIAVLGDPLEPGPPGCATPIPTPPLLGRLCLKNP